MAFALHGDCEGLGLIDSGRFVREDGAANRVSDPQIEAAYLGHAEAGQ